MSGQSAKPTVAAWDRLHQIVGASRAGVMVYLDDDGMVGIWMFGDLDEYQVSGLVHRGLAMYEHGALFGEPERR